MSALGELMDEIAATIRAAVDDAELDIEVHSRLVVQPHAPLAIDVIPADPFTDTTGAGFGDYTGRHNFMVRARLTAPDHDAAQDWLLELMDDASDFSVAAALLDEETLNGHAQSLTVDGPSGYTQFLDPGATAAYLGVEWRVGVLRAYS